MDYINIEIIVEQIIDTISKNYELVETTVTNDGETITKVYTIEPNGAHKQMI